MTEQIGSRVKQLLERASGGRTDREIAQTIGMTPDAFSRSMNGKRSFSAAELARLATELNTSTHWLITGELDPSAVSVAARHAFDFDRMTHNAPDWHQVEQQLSDVALAYQQVLDQFEESDQLSELSTAEEVRAQLIESHGRGFVGDLAAAVETALGVDVIRMEGIDRAYSLRIGPIRAIVVKQTSNWFYQNWSIAHELAHLVSGQLAPLDDKTAVENKFESLANAFAADLLLPKQDLFRMNWKAMTPSAVAGFVWDSGVSTNALRNRLNALGIEVSSKVMSLLSMTTQRLLRQFWADALGAIDQISTRMERAATRRFAPRLIAAHFSAITSGRLHSVTLAWMLGVDGSELESELVAEQSSADLDWLELELGFRGDSVS